MALILHVDTALRSASVCLAQNGTVISIATSQTERDAAGWLHPAIQQMVREKGRKLSELEAVAVSAGPGSYTGLRVGMAAAKGLCYALDIPLITINTLQMMAAEATEHPGRVDLLCPMIDARRMEVFTALYKPSLEEVARTENLILTTASFADILQHQRIAFFGSGSAKFQPLVSSQNALFMSSASTAADMVGLADKSFAAGEFADLAYAEPFYAKGFHSTVPKKIY